MNPLHPNPNLIRVYPTKEDIQKWQALDKLSLNSPYSKLPSSRIVFEKVLDLIRTVSRRLIKNDKWSDKLFFLRLRLISWYYGPQESEYMSISPTCLTGFYDKFKD